MESPTERLHIALLLDENIDEKLGFALRRYGYQALTVWEVGRKGRDLLRKTLHLLDTFSADELVNRVVFI